ncbi:hypothetical protein ACFX11_039146 [Malus domestica]
MVSICKSRKRYMKQLVSDKRRVGSYDYHFGGGDHCHCSEHGGTAVGGEWIFERERDDDKLAGDGGVEKCQGSG